METYEYYALHLHGDNLDSLPISDSQKQLIELFKLYDNPNHLISEIKNLIEVKNRHDTGIEFCGELGQKKRIAVTVHEINKSSIVTSPQTKHTDHRKVKGVSYQTFLRLKREQVKRYMSTGDTFYIACRKAGISHDKISI
jgi:hypothetical protein